MGVMRHAYLLLQSLAYESKLGILRRLLWMLMASELGAYRAGAILCEVADKCSVGRTSARGAPMPRASPPARAVIPVPIMAAQTSSHLVPRCHHVHDRPLFNTSNRRHERRVHFHAGSGWLPRFRYCIDNRPMNAIISGGLRTSKPRSELTIGIAARVTVFHLYGDTRK